MRYICTTYHIGLILGYFHDIKLIAKFIQYYFNTFNLRALIYCIIRSSKQYINTKLKENTSFQYAPAVYCVGITTIDLVFIKPILPKLSIPSIVNESIIRNPIRKPFLFKEKKNMQFFFILCCCEIHLESSICIVVYCGVLWAAGNRNNVLKL